MFESLICLSLLLFLLRHKCLHRKYSVSFVLLESDFVDTFVGVSVNFVRMSDSGNVRQWGLRSYGSALC